MSTEVKTQLLELADYRKVCQNMLFTEQDQGEAGLNKLLAGICENSQFQVPETLEATEANNLLKDYEKQLRYQGINLLNYIHDQGLTMEEFKNRLRSQARDKLQKESVLEAIAEREGIAVTKTELHAEIHELAKVHHIDFESAWEKLELEGDLEKVERKKLMEKTMDFLRQLAGC